MRPCGSAYKDGNWTRPQLARTWRCYIWSRRLPSTTAIQYFVWIVQELVRLMRCTPLWQVEWALNGVLLSSSGIAAVMFPLTSESTTGMNLSDDGNALVTLRYNNRYGQLHQTHLCNRLVIDATSAHHSEIIGEHSRNHVVPSVKSCIFIQWPVDVTELFPRCCWTLIWLSRHWAWLRRGYWRYSSLNDWLIDWLIDRLIDCSPLTTPAIQ